MLSNQSPHREPAASAPADGPQGRKWVRRLVYPCSPTTARAFGEAGFSERLPGNQKQRNPITRSPSPPAEMCLRALLNSRCNSLCELALGALRREKCPWSRLSMSPGVTVLRVSASAQGSSVPHPKHTEASPSCPTQSQLGNTKERGLKSCLVLGPKLRRLSTKIIPKKQ